MRELSPPGRQAVDDLAQRHDFSPQAVAGMLESIVQGRGSMAQFNHPEFGGSGQWMRGGMTMLSDMFNHQLKGRVDALCNDLATLVASQPELAAGGGSVQSQRQGHGAEGAGDHRHDPGWQTQSGGELEAPVAAPASVFATDAAAGGGSGWWPAELHRPDSTGAQNGMRYAYFANPHRLAIEAGGAVTVYDTLDHRIGGFSQQQSGTATLTFSSQHGPVDVARLPVVSSPGRERPAAAPAAVPTRHAEPAPQPRAANDEVITTIEKLARLHADGVLSNEEFSTKKAELLARL